MVIEKCSNCDSVIGRLEPAFIYNNHIMCKICHDKLTALQPPQTTEGSVKEKTKKKTSILYNLMLLSMAMLLLAYIIYLGRSTGCEDLTVVVTVVATVVVVIYLMPTFIAFRRNHPNRYVIMVLNICLGATLIVWLLCLIWALGKIKVPPKATA